MKTGTHPACLQTACCVETCTSSTASTGQVPTPPPPALTHRCKQARAVLLHCYQYRNARCPICCHAALHPNDAQALRRLAHKFAAGALLCFWLAIVAMLVRFPPVCHGPSQDGAKRHPPHNPVLCLLAPHLASSLHPLLPQVAGCCKNGRTCLTARRPSRPVLCPSRELHQPAPLRPPQGPVWRLPRPAQA